MEAPRGPRTPETPHSRDVLLQNATAFLASRGVNLETVVGTGQSIEIKLKFDPSSERAIPDSVKNFLKRKYKGVDISLNSITVGYEPAAAHLAGQRYASTIRLEALQNGIETQLGSMGGIIVPHDESVRESTVVVRPDTEPARWNVQRAPLGQVIRNGSIRYGQTLSGSVDPRVIADIASLLPDTNPVSRETKRHSKSERLKQGVEAIMRRWHPDPTSPIEPPTKSILIQSPQIN